MNADQIIPTLEKYILADGSRIIPDLAGSHGSMLRDAVSGEKYLDMMTYFASMALSYDHPALHEETFLTAAAHYAPYKPSNPDFYTAPYAQFTESLVKLLPGDMSHLFFIETGALAVENAMKAAFDWKARKNRESGIAGGADQIISFDLAFHGRSGYALSVTHSPDVHKALYFPTFDWPVFSLPERVGATDESWQKGVAGTLAQIDAYCRKNPHKVAGLIIEPIQGEGGNRLFGKEVFCGLRALAERHEFMLIYDEIQCGMGISGHTWAFEAYGVAPDLLVFGKKTQVCGFAAGPRIDEVTENVFRVSSRISGTWCGSPTDFLRGSVICDVLPRERLAENAKNRGRDLLAGLKVLEEKYAIMSRARGDGLMIAFDLPSDEIRKKFLNIAQDRAHLLLLPCGEYSVRFRPVLDIDKETVFETLDRVEKALKAMK